MGKARNASFCADFEDWVIPKHWHLEEGATPRSFFYEHAFPCAENHHRDLENHMVDNCHYESESEKI